MKYIVYPFLFVFGCIPAISQELNATVIINAEQTGQSNLQVFKTLERSLTEYINETNWTDDNYKQQERIDCSFNIIITQFDVDTFEATVQIQSSRPIYNSNYSSPILNYNDRDFSFSYTEFQPLLYNPNVFSSNLVSVITYYVYTILGMDAHTFKLNGGEEYFQEAKRIVNTAQQSNFKGWKPQDGQQSRFRLNEDLLSPNFRDFQSIMYQYHRLGLDKMAADVKGGKTTIANTLLKMKGLYNKRPNNFISRVFFDAKAEEIKAIFSDGPQVQISELVETLNRVSPTKASYWRDITF